MIEYVEIYSLEGGIGYSRLELTGLVDDFASVIWKNDYYGAGEFEIYAPATEANMALLVPERYVMTSCGGTDEVAIIERVEVANSLDEGRMITASGRFAKSILDRRIVYTPVYDSGEGGNGYIWHCRSVTLSGKVDLAAISLVRDNAANPPKNNQYLKGDRHLPALGWNPGDYRSRYPETISISTEESEESAEKQVTYKNLLDYTDGLLEEYGLAARLFLYKDYDNLLHYYVYKGVSRTVRDHPEGEPIVFSMEMDNLLNTDYVYDVSPIKTTALIGGEGEGLERKCAFAYEWISGMERREVFVDASSITSEVEEGETPPTMEEYRKQLEAQGQQTVATSPAEETLSGSIDISNSTLRYREDFYLGDLVTVEDRFLGISADVRILSVTEVQDENGYNIDMEYANK